MGTGKKTYGSSGRVIAERAVMWQRVTRETKVEVTLALDGNGNIEVATGIGFFDHMLESLARHAGFDLMVKVAGDLNVDAHHTVEDTGLVLGEALRWALGEKTGINRFGQAIVPMDDALILVAVDISGRAGYYGELQLTVEKVGELPTELVDEFWLAMVRSAGITMHVRQLAGRNSHHIIEALFKAAGRALRQAVARDERAGGMVPSTKGLL